MKSKKGVIEFYRKNKEWIENVVSNAEYPRILRAAAGAVIEVAIEEGKKGEK
jgi:hypothetical protein